MATRKRTLRILGKGELSVLDRALQSFQKDINRKLWNTTPGSRHYEERARDRDIAREIRTRIVGE